MIYQYGTESEHRATADVAKAKDIRMVWTGDIKRSLYLAENLEFIQETGLAVVSIVMGDSQSSYYKIEWSDS